MKSKTILGVGLAAGLAAAACASGPTVIVHANPPGQVSEPEQGDTVKFTERSSERFAGHSSGFAIVRSKEEWQKYWAESPAGTRPAAPLMNFDEQMLLTAYASTSDAAEVHITRVIDSGGALHVYVEEKVAGSGCPPMKDAPYDVVAVERSDKVTHFHVDRVPLEACNNAPPVAGKVICRKTGATDWSDKVQVAPGDNLECEADSRAGMHAVAERNWFFSQLPPGSMAKLSFLRDGARVTFPIDNFGHFGLTLEISDEDGRKSTSVASIDSKPPPTETFVELAWTGFDPNDDPSTFPRIALHVTEASQQALDIAAARALGKKTGALPHPPAGAADCSLESSNKPSWCDIKAANYLTLLHVRPSSAPAYNLAVDYTDDRYVGGPVPCVRVFFGGRVTTERCDKVKRAAGETWELGILDAKTSAFPPEAESTVAPLDGGAPAPASAPVGDAGAAPPAKGVDAGKK